MESLGEYLRRQRELKGLSLKDLSDETKIGINYLKYIEENYFDKIPGEVFVKGFLRLYARSVGLKEEDVMGKYYEQYEIKEKEKENKEDAGLKVLRESRRKLPLWLWVITIILFAILLFKVFPQKKKHTPVSAREVRKLIEIEPSPIVSKEIPKANDVPKEMTLSVEAVEETWVKIIIDGMEVKESLLKGGDKVSFTAKKNFGLTIGNAGGVKIRFDGKELKPLGPQGKVIRNLVLSRDTQTPISQ